MKPIPALCAAAFLMASPFAAVAEISAAAADPLILLDSLEGCHAWQEAGATQEALSEILSDGSALALEATEMHAIEFRCEFAPALVFDWRTDSITTHVGHCMEPGWIAPGLFTFMMSPYEVGQVRMYDGSDQPTVFYACDM